MTMKGVIPPVITPYFDDGTLDKEGLEAMLEFLIGAGVHTILVGGSTGEYYAQTLEERVDVMHLAHEIINKRVPLMIGTGATRTEDSVYLAEKAKAAGADMILITSPPYAMPDQQENALHALRIDRAADLPIMLYNYPDRMGVMMGPEYLARVSRSKNFQAIKESSGDVNRIHLLAREFPHIGMFCGMDDQALEFFAWGAAGWVCAGSNFLPAEHLALYRACAIEGNFDKGRRIMSALLPLMTILEQSGKFVSCVKYGCEIVGLRAGPPRPPLRPLSKEDKRALRQVVETLQTTVAKIVEEG